MLQTKRDSNAQVPRETNPTIISIRNEAEHTLLCYSIHQKEKRKKERDACNVVNPARPQQSTMDNESIGRVVYTRHWKMPCSISTKATFLVVPSFLFSFFIVTPCQVCMRLVYIFSRGSFYVPSYKRPYFEVLGWHLTIYGRVVQTKRAK